MRVGDFKLQPICIYLTDTPEWAAKWEQAKEYFSSQFIEDITWVRGIHAEISGLKSSRPYLLDNPEENWFIPQKTVGVNVSVMMANAVMASHPEVEHWLLMEMDCRYQKNWQARLKQALKDVPPDFDFLIGGSCCAMDKPMQHIKGEIFEVKYPFCGHMTIISKRGVELTIEKQRDLTNPGDIEKTRMVFPSAKVYTILPTIALQLNTELVP